MFGVVEYDGHLTVLSATTGAEVRRFPTGAGTLSLDAAGTDVYYTTTDEVPGPVPIERGIVATGAVTQVARGVDPAVSPDGTRLAYLAPADHLVTLDLATATSTTIDLRTALGSAVVLGDAETRVTWLGDATVAVVEGPPGTPYGGSHLLSGRPSSATAATTATATTPGAPRGVSCRDIFTAQHTCVLLVRPADAAGTIHVASLPSTVSVGSAFGVDPGTGDLLVGGAGTVQLFRLGAEGAALVSTRVVPDNGLVAAFSPSGTSLLYLTPKPIRLGRASVGPTITPTALLLPSADLQPGGLSW